MIHNFFPIGKKIINQHLSLSGTLVNCSGGQTPWNTWISCEETVKKSSVTTPKRVNNVTQTEIKKVTETPTPEKVRPAQPNLKWEDYRSDAQVRWEIHQYETKELWSDMVKVYHSVKPIVLKSVDYVKDSYDRAFNQDSK